ncbi:MAG: ACT domain-containing protein [Gammaproteobacteria bacterium]
MSEHHRLELLPETCAIARLDPDADVPDWIAGEFQSVSRTNDELSIVCAESCVPVGVAAQRGFRCFRIAGKLDFAATGILESLLGPLADAHVSVFVVSTFDTDYVLVPGGRLEDATAALASAGHVVDQVEWRD